MRAAVGEGRCVRAAVGEGRCVRAAVGEGRCVRAAVGEPVEPLTGDELDALERGSTGAAATSIRGWPCSAGC